jgi:glycosyltransferase involved in cell wall biosynthesis
MDTNIDKPLISVLMIVYNAEKYVAEAIESVRNQTYKNWELIIVYDNSTDRTLSIIEKEASEDRRIKIIKNNDKKPGILESRNISLETAKGKYLAILDSDDIALPQRLSVQCQFMENHPDIAVAGSWVFVQNNDRGNMVMKNETDPDIVSGGLLFNTMIANPSSMIRKSFLDEHKIKYDPEFAFAEDYAMWVKCAEYGKITNIADILVIYRQHEESHTVKSRERQSVDVPRLRETLLTKIGLYPTEEELKLHNTTVTDGNKNIFVEKSLVWLNKIKDANNTTRKYKNYALSYILEKRFYLICRQNLGLKNFLLFLKNPFGKMMDHIYKSLKLFIKLIL